MKKEFPQATLQILSTPHHEEANVGVEKETAQGEGDGNDGIRQEEAEVGVKFFAENCSENHSEIYAFPSLLAMARG